MGVSEKRSHIVIELVKEVWGEGTNHKGVSLETQKVSVVKQDLAVDENEVHGE